MREVLDTAIFVFFVAAIFLVLGNIGDLTDPLVLVTFP